MVWRVAFNRWTSYSCKRLAVSLLAVNRPWIVGNNLAGNVIGRVATLECYCCRVVWLNSLVVFVNVVNRFRNRLLIRIFVGCARVCRAMLEVNFIGWRADTKLSTWLEAIRYQNVAIAFELLDAFSRAVRNRFIRVAVQIILTQRLAGRVINVLDISRLRVRRVEDSKRWALFGITVGTALYYGFAWRVTGNRW